MQTLVRVMIMYSDIAVHNTKCPTVEGFQLTEISLPLIIKNLYSKKDLFLLCQNEIISDLFTKSAYSEEVSNDAQKIGK